MTADDDSRQRLTLALRIACAGLNSLIAHLEASGDGTSPGERLSVDAAAVADAHASASAILDALNPATTITRQ